MDLQWYIWAPRSVWLTTAMASSSTVVMTKRFRRVEAIRLASIPPLIIHMVMIGRAAPKEQAVSRITTISNGSKNDHQTCVTLWSKSHHYCALRLPILYNDNTQLESMRNSLSNNLGAQWRLNAVIYSTSRRCSASSNLISQGSQAVKILLCCKALLWVKKCVSCDWGT